MALSRRWALLLGAVLVVAACAGPTAGPPDPAAPGAADDDARTVVVRGPAGDERRFSVEVAAEPRARRRGLMHRPELPADAGMLFVFPDDTTGGFWMKDTYVPLTIAFARADGTIVAVRDMEPCWADPCPSYRPGQAYRMALEVNQGALGETHLGWRLEVVGGLPPAR